MKQFHKRMIRILQTCKDKYIIVVRKYIQVDI